MKNGTGKGMMALILHAASLRRPQAFISVAYNGLSNKIVESELMPWGGVRRSVKGREIGIMAQISTDDEFVVLHGHKRSTMRVSERLVSRCSQG